MSVALGKCKIKIIFTDPFEKDLSADATLTGVVKRRLQAVTASGRISDKLFQNNILVHLEHNSKFFSKEI